MPYYEENQSGTIVPLVGDVPDDAIRSIERADDDAIVQRMTSGFGADAFIYKFTIRTSDGPKDVIGISSAGADEMAKMLGNMETLNDARIDKDSDPDYIYAMVRVKDMIRNVILMGVGRQCKYQVGKGNLPDHDRMDEHAFVKALTKGQRNGILHHVSEDTVLKIINTFKTQGKDRRIAPPRMETSGQTGRPPATTAVTTKAPPQTTQQVRTPPPAQQSSTPVTAEAPKSPSPSDADAMAKQIAAQQEKLKGLRVDVNNRFQTDLGMTREQRQKICKEAGLPESLTEMTEEQLKKAWAIADTMVQEKINKMNSQIEARRQVEAAAKSSGQSEEAQTELPTTQPVVAPPSGDKPAYEAMGFESKDEQDRLVGRLYTLLTAPEQLALKLEEAKKFVTDRGFTSSRLIPKDKLTAIIEEVASIIEAKKTPNSF